MITWLMHTSAAMIGLTVFSAQSGNTISMHRQELCKQHHALKCIAAIRCVNVLRLPVAPHTPRITVVENRKAQTAVCGAMMVGVMNRCGVTLEQISLTAALNAGMITISNVMIAVPVVVPVAAMVARGSENTNAK